MLFNFAQIKLTHTAKPKRPLSLAQVRSERTQQVIQPSPCQRVVVQNDDGEHGAVANNVNGRALRDIFFVSRIVVETQQFFGRKAFNIG